MNVVQLRRRRALAAMIANGGIFETAPVGVVSDIVLSAAGVSTTARDVYASISNGIHLTLSRGFSADARFASRNLRNAIESASLVAGFDQRERRFGLAGESEEAGRFLFVGIKLVASSEAASGADELWLTTAHPLGPRTLDRYLRGGRLRRLSDVDD